MIAAHVVTYIFAAGLVVLVRVLDREPQQREDKRHKAALREATKLLRGQP